MAEVEWCSPVGGEVVLYVLVRSPVLPACPGLDVRSPKLPCFDLFWTEDISVDLGECIPLEVGSLHVEGVCCAAMIEARNGFRDWNVGVGSSLSLSLLIGLVGAVTGVGLVGPLSIWDRRDSVPSCGREGYVVLPKSGERVVAVVVGRVEPSSASRSCQGHPCDVGGRGVDLFWLDLGVIVATEDNGEVPLCLSESSFSVSWVPGSHGIFRVANGVRRHSIAPWVCCCLASPYMPHRGAWVLNLGGWGATTVELPGATSVEPLGIVSGREVLPTQKVFVGGGIPNRDRSPVKGTGGGRCANRCQVRANSWLSLLEAGDDIVSGEWGEVEIGPRDPPSAEESQSLQMSADLLSIYECED